MLYIFLYINAAAMVVHFLSKGFLRAASSYNQLNLLQIYIIYLSLIKIHWELHKNILKK